MNLLDALYIPAAIATAPWWARKTRSDWGQRLGRIPPLPPKPAGTRRVLIHAVSVGEVNTLRELVPMLLGRGVQVVVSVGTDTGIARARSLFEHAPGVFVVRYALDFSGAVNRFLDAVRPDAAVLVELEVWPNFISACKARGVLVGVINGRLSAKSFAGYSRVRAFLRSTFASLEFAAVQDQEYASRFRAMGVADDRVLVTGSMKWDAATVLEPGHALPGAEELARELGIDRSKPLIVAGSTAPLRDTCEEALLHAACPEGVQLLCAPRKPEHAAAAHAALGGPGVCTRRSDRKPGPPGTSRFLLDTIGELRAAYALADVVVVGRTFGELGGSDPIEPIALGRATISGPKFANFAAVMELFQHAGAVEVVHAPDVPASLRRLLSDSSRRLDMATRGQACVRAQQGATARHAELILGRLLALHSAANRDSSDGRDDKLRRNEISNHAN